MSTTETTGGLGGRIRAGDIFLLSNLLSLSRVFLTPVIIGLLFSEIEHRLLYAFGLIVVCALTDFLDGFVARKLNQVTTLGLVLDPVADKVLTLTLLVVLTATGRFPFWAAALIIARDIAIMAGGVVLRKKQRPVPASNLVGKYYFGSVAAMLMSYVLEFRFGEVMFLWWTIVFFGLSSVNYGRMFVRLMQDREAGMLFKGRIWTIAIRITAVIVVAVSLYRLYTDMLK